MQFLKLNVSVWSTLREGLRVGAIGKPISSNDQ